MDLSPIVQQAIDREVDDAWEHLDPADAAFFEQLVRSRAAAAQTAMGWDLWNSAAALSDAEPLMRTQQACLACGCTEHHACPQGCWWVTPHLCSSCADEGDLLAATVHGGARPLRLTYHLWYRNRELVACAHARSTSGQPLTGDDVAGTSRSIGQGLDEDPSAVTCLDCLRVGHYWTRAAAAAALARLRVGEPIAHDDPRIVPVRSKLLQVGTPLDAFRLDLPAEPPALPAPEPSGAEARAEGLRLLKQAKEHLCRASRCFARVSPSLQSPALGVAVDVGDIEDAVGALLRRLESEGGAS